MRTSRLDERRLREVGSSGGAEEECKEFSLKFKCVTKETNLECFEAMKWAEKEETVSYTPLTLPTNHSQ